MCEIQKLTTLDIVDKLKFGLLLLGILATPLTDFPEIEKVIFNYETRMVSDVDDAT